MTMKDQAFALFDKGFTPLHQQVKAIGMTSQTRATYYYQWKQERGITTEEAIGGGTGGEQVGGIIEHKLMETAKSELKNPIEANNNEPESLIEANPGEFLDEENPPPEEAPKASVESISGVTEAHNIKGKDGKPTDIEKKVATSVADEGIKCVVFLNLETLALFKYAASIQSQAGNGDGALLLGDFIDTCARDFFEVRGKKLGLINTGG